MKYYSFSSFEQDVKILAKKIKSDFNPDAILGIARGGLTLAHFLANGLDIRDCFSLNSIHYEKTKKLDTIEIYNIPDLSKFKKVLITDDIVDSGETLVAIKKEINKLYPNLQLCIATIFYKPKALIIPNFSIREADDWIEFFWDLSLD
ncbi:MULTISPECIES: phosphoribosyltransferase [Campylobacter]|uniref:Putative nucleotide phosphoribosyltransferase n=1 Tax=Campylobacter porcelli TaxID=1660073 RepID=A0A1X9SWC5_9BACT|nr:MULTISPECIES: phosphoribosyltransferase family protein [unclassified Campylobacter]ARR00542.1 putative nucleotide phosphoribosyltransferase [Campylobacter sp. RM6137]MCR8678564.1 phosphoribosyltransferase family protein [Campylobacter sp. RM19072]MCR8696419.1 phosphoribosyltransferase family protein [Campylobacter sp. RM19073]MEE3704082.1 phosphoribosyltransferase family protein [Campylobacter sp. CX2-8023-23]